MIFQTLKETATRAGLSLKGPRGLFAACRGSDSGYGSGSGSGSGSGGRQGGHPEAGNVIWYIFAAVALFASLAFVLARPEPEFQSSQNAYRISEEAVSQARAIQAAIMECAIEYPQGGGDEDGDSDIDANDNPNIPFPLQPTSIRNPNGAAANEQVRNLQCPGATTTAAWLFAGATAGSTVTRFLPPPPDGFNEWTYVTNGTDGVYFETTALSVGQVSNLVLGYVDGRFSPCEVDTDTATGRIRVFVRRRSACP